MPGTEHKANGVTNQENSYNTLKTINIYLVLSVC